MSFCINPSCLSPQNQGTQLFCHSCSSQLLLEGRYRVMRQLGSGGFGKTYEVNDRDGTSKVLKVLTSNHPKYIELFQREAQVLSRLQHHGIPKVEPDAYFLFSPRNSQEPLHCLVMEKIEGLNLQEYLHKRGSPIDEKLAIAWMTQLASILQEVHNQNFFHRDIKPSNIMLRADGQLVLIDFGTAREVTESFVTKRAHGQITAVMSAGYTPPEQLYGQAVPQSDFFALGRTFVCLLTGKDVSQLYDASTDQLRWREAASVISPQLANLLDRLMARFPSQRPQSVQEICQYLAQINNTGHSIGVHSHPTAPVNHPAAEPTQYIPLSSPLSAQPDQNQQWVATAPPPTANNTPNIPATTPPPPPQLAPGFIGQCQEELAELIGPIAATICKRTLAKNPTMQATEFIDALAKHIPNQMQALEFQRRLLS